MTIRIVRAVENGEMMYRVQVRDYFIWSTQYKTTDKRRAEKLYRDILKSRNVTKG